MKLIKPSFEILTPIDGQEILKTIEKVARTCYKSEDKIDEQSAEKMVKSLISRGHEAMIEFFDITVKFTCDRGVSHEIVRHRLASYAQESTRYCNYSKDKFDGQITYIIPSWMDDYLPTDNAYCGNDDAWWNTFKDINDPKLLWLNSMQVAENNYIQLLKLGWQPQQARAVLPNSLKTEINVKMNLREWRHFFRLRCAPAAHPQMRELAIPLLENLKMSVPIIFDDIIY
jgi:thymidylate synthase (FAD)